MGTPKGAGAARATEEGELVARIAAGEEAALAALYDRYAGTVLALLLRVVGSRARAEELLQDVFLQVWRRASDYATSRGSVAAWLFTIARNRGLDVVRSAEHRRAVAVDEPPPVVDDVAPGPDEEAAAEQAGRAVRRALATLTPLQRQALELAYYEGLSHSEIAERLEQPLGTVKSRIGQGMARLRGLLATEGPALLDGTEEPRS